jgi:hypothetical protein
MSAAVAVGERRFSLAHLTLVIPWVALVIDAWAPIGDNSFLWHIRAGILQLEQGTVLTADPFSFTAGGESWLTQSWLAELLYARLEASSGLDFVPWLLLVLTALTFVGIGLLAFKTSQSALATAVVLLLSTISLISFLVPRPVIFSYLLFVLVILAWERPASRWSLPFLFWIWAWVVLPGARLRGLEAAFEEGMACAFISAAIGAGRASHPARVGGGQNAARLHGCQPLSEPADRMENARAILTCFLSGLPWHRHHHLRGIEAAGHAT